MNALNKKHTIYRYVEHQRSSGCVVSHCLAFGNIIGGAGFEIFMTIATAGVIKAVKCHKIVVSTVDGLNDLAPDDSIVR